MNRWLHLMATVAAVVLLAEAPLAAGQDAPVAAIAESREKLPPSERMQVWSLEWKSSAEDVLLGEAYGYIHLHVSRYGKANQFPNVHDARPVLNDDPQGFDRTHYVTCVDLRTGDRLWTRQLNGSIKLFVDPRDDSLWSCGQTLMHIDRASGELLEQRDMPAEWRSVAGLVLGDKTPMRVGRQADGRDRVSVYNVATRQIETAPYLKDIHLSPNRLRLISTGVAQSPTRAGMALTLIPPNGGAAQWAVPFPGYWSNLGTWIGDDVLMLTGTPGTPAFVMRIDGATGSVKWQTRLHGGAYDLLRLPSLAGIPAKRWEPVGVIAGQVVALSAGGAMHWIDATTGELQAIYSGVQRPLSMPLAIGETLVVAEPDRLMAVPLEVARGLRYPEEAKLRAAEVSSLVKAGSGAQAMEIARHLVEVLPDHPESWDCLLQAAVATTNPAVEARAACRAMSLRGAVSSSDLHSRFGLLRSIPTGPIRARARMLGRSIYVGTLDGELIRLDAGTLAVTSVEQCSVEISSLSISSGWLQRGSDRQRVQVAQAAAGEITAEDMPRDPEQLKAAPAAWHRMSGGDGPIVKHDQRYYRPLAGGAVRVTDLETVREFASPLQGIGKWSIYMGPGGPLGYGDGGVYELDENLCPARKLIATRPPREGRSVSVSDIASDGKTIAIAVPESRSMTVQIWSIDGKTKLRDEQAMGSPADRDNLRLLAVEGGYLWVGGELLWISPDRQQPSWRFSLDEPVMLYDWRGLQTWFTSSILADGRMFVTASSGGILIFDVDAVCPKR